MLFYEHIKQDHFYFQTVFIIFDNEKNYIVHKFLFSLILFQYKYVYKNRCEVKFVLKLLVIPFSFRLIEFIEQKEPDPSIELAHELFRLKRQKK